MIAATAKPFRSLTARDLMSRDMLVIPVKASLRHAAHLLSQSRVSGAPVVDALGRVVGVLSTTDFVRWMDEGDHAGKPEPHASVCTDWEVVGWESLPTDEVSSYMTSDPVTVTPDASIARLARMMLDAHIHRLIVVDQENRPAGIVTSTDILAAVAQHEESR
jgi:CBS domain-containing protein